MASKTVQVIIVGDSKSAQRALSQLSTTAGASESKLSALGSKLDSVGGSLVKAGHSLTTHVTLPLIGIGAAAVKLSVDFEDSMQKIVGLVGVSQHQVDGWSKQILDLAPKLAQAPKDLADGLFFVTSAGFRGAAAMNVLTMSAKAASAGLGDVHTVADAVTSALNAYKGTGLTAAHATDVMVAAVREGKMPAEDLAGVLGNVLPIASQMGVTFDQVAAAIAAATREGLSAAKAGTGIRFLLSSFMKPSTEAIAALKSVGISVDELQKQLSQQGLQATLEDLAAKFDLTSAKGKAAFATVVGGARGLATASILVGQNMDAARSILDGVTHSAGAMDKAFRTASETAGFKLKSALDSLQSAGVELGDALAPSLIKVAGSIKDIAQKFSDLNPTTQEAIIKWGALAAAAGPVISIFGRLAQGASFVVKGLNSMVKTIGGPATAAVVGMGVVLANLEQSQIRSQMAAGALYDEISKGGKSLQTAGDQLQVLIEKNDSLKTSFSEGLQAIAYGSSTSSGELLAFIKRMGDAYDKAKSLAAQGMEATSRIQMAQVRVQAATLSAAQANADYGSSSDQARAASDKLKAAQDSLASAMHLQGAAAREAAVAEQTLIQTEHELRGLSDNLTTAQLDLKDAQRAHAEAVRQLNDLESKGVHSGKEYELAHENVKRTLIAMHQAADSARRATSQLRDEVQAAAEKGRVTEQAFVKLGDAYGLNRQKLKGLIGDLDGGGDHLRSMGEKAGLTKSQLAILGAALESLQKPAQHGTQLAAQAVGKLPALVRALASPARAAGLSVGAAIGEGARSGIAATAAAVAGQASSMVMAAVRSAKEAAGIQSPSKVFREIGKNIADGLTLGIGDGSTDAQKAWDDLVNHLVNKLKDLRSQLSSFNQGIASGFGQFGDIGNFFSNGQGTGVDGTITHDDVTAFYQQQARDAHKLADDLKRLAALGLNKKELARIAGMGPDGIPVAEAILAGGKNLVQQVNQSDRAIGAYEHHAENVLDNKFFAKKIDELHKDLVDLKDRLGKLKSGESIVINGDVYGWDDFKKKVDKALSESVTKKRTA